MFFQGLKIRFYSKYDFDNVLYRKIMIVVIILWAGIGFGEKKICRKKIKKNFSRLL